MSIHENGLTAGAHIWLPSLERLNEIRAEEGLSPLERDEVPDNIHFVSEIPVDGRPSTFSSLF